MRKSLPFTFSLLILSFTAPAAWAANPPTTYNVTTSTQYYTQPPLPTSGPGSPSWVVNTIYTDPTFGSPIVRVTDGNTMGTNKYFLNLSYGTPSSSQVTAWNADTTKFLFLTSGGGYMIYNFTAATLQSSCLTQIAGSPYQPPSYPCAVLPLANASFSFSDPNLMYGVAVVNGHNWLETYDLGSQTYSQLVDFNVLISTVPVHNSVIDMAVSASSQVVAAMGDFQDDAPYLVFYDMNTKVSHVINTVTSTYDGQPLTLNPGGPLDWGLHGARISKDGQYVQFAPGAFFGPNTIPPGNSDGKTFWDVPTAQVYYMPGYTGTGGHWDMGYNGYFVNQSDIAGDNDYALSFLLRKLDPADISNPVYLMPINTKPPYFDYDSHPSWVDAQPTGLVPFITSFDYDASTNTSLGAALPYGGEIDAVATDGSQTVWRFAFNRGVCNPTPGEPGVCYFNDTTRGNVSQDGQYFIFTSDWDNALGTDPSGLFRTDVFIVALSGNPAPPPPPPPPTNPPTANTTGAVFAPRVYPNPWRSDRHSGSPITFDQLTGNITIKIFTVSGHLAKTLSTSNASVPWDLTNDSGDKVASGIYVYLATNDQGQKAKGKVAIIR